VAYSRNLTFRYGLALGMTLAALALAGCGRKGPLELPPSASAVPQERQPQSPGLSPLSASQPAEPANQRSAIGEPAGIARDGRAIAPVGEKRHIPLDVLID
jgi:predicted small lipoprotein YifL